MVRSRAISRNLVIDRFPVKISYPGQALECDICGESGHIAKNGSLRGKCLECRQSGHFQRNFPVRLRRLQRSEDSLDPVPPGDVSGSPLGASTPGAGPPHVVLSGVPPIAPLVNQPDEVTSHPVLGSCEESSSVDVRDNQLDEFASQSILANVSVDSPVSASAGSFGIRIGSSQPPAETQIPNLSAPVDTVTSDVSSDNDSLVTVSDGEITSSSNESNISELSTTKENISESNVMENTSTTKVNISESNDMESTSIINENISNTKNSNVNDNVSKS